jgi:hypothetical protein
MDLLQTLLSIYAYPFLNVYKRLLWRLNRNFGVWGGGVADPKAFESKTYIINII